MYQQLTLPQRAVLAQLFDLNVPVTEIARRLNVNRSTIYRERTRNSVLGQYDASAAQRRAQRRRQLAQRPGKMAQPEVERYVRRHLCAFWSPDQIAGRARWKFKRQRERWPSRQTIYNWIERQPDRRAWRACLRFGVSRRRQRRLSGGLPNAACIEGRPRVVDTRRRFGDWEGDTLVGKGRRSGLVSVVERKSGFTLLARVNDLTASSVRSAIERRMKPVPASLRHTLTFDNGKEFAEHESLAAATGVDVYFAKPYCAWQRGTNENTNGLVRQYLPKGTDLRAVSHHAVAAIEHSLNDRPRKRLGYQTPNEVLAATKARHRVALQI